MGDVAPGKTTFEIPDTVFRRAESVAAHRGIPIIDFVTPFRVCLGVVGLDACASAYTSPGVGCTDYLAYGRPLVENRRVQRAFSASTRAASHQDRCVFHLTKILLRA